MDARECSRADWRAPMPHAHLCRPASRARSQASAHGFHASTILPSSASPTASVVTPAVRSALRGWGGAATVVLLSLALVRWSERLPRVVPATAVAGAFSAERAWPVVLLLADTIGHRVAGTPGARRAAAELFARLRQVPGLEVELQEATSVRATRFGARAYHATNVVARLPGDSASAVLVSSHYDGQEEGVAAADAAVPTAVIVEMARALAASPRLRHTVVLNINGAEERGLLGADAFLRHRWMKDVRAFIDLESAGTSGKAILFQVGPGNSWLASAYARSVPHPYGTVIGQDVFQSGVVPSRTDFEVYAAAGVAGLDIAFFRDGYAYHTALDEPSNIALGSVQHMGANALAIVRELASGPLPGNVSASSVTYHDVLGLWMITYSARTARLLALLASALGFGAIVMAAWRLRIPVVLLATRAVLSAVAAALGVVVATGASALPFYVAGRAHGWFAHPGRGVVAYGGLALAAMLAIHWLVWRRRAGHRDRPDEGGAVASWCGGLMMMMACLVLLTSYGLGSAYLFLWWVVPGSVGLLLLAATHDRHWWLAASVGFVPGVLLTTQFAELLLALFVPIAGRMTLAVPFDVVVAGLVSVPTVAVATMPLALVHRCGRPGVAALAIGIVGILALLITATTFPFTPRRPQRIAIAHHQMGDSARLVVESGDFLGPGAALARVPGATPRPKTRMIYDVPAKPAPDEETPIALAVASEPDGAGERTIELRLARGNAYTYVIRIPMNRLAGWSVAEPIALPTQREPPAVLQLIAAPDTGWRVSLRVRGEEPVPLTVSSLYLTVTPSARQLMQLLPPWTTAHAVTVHRRQLAF